jgi:type II secretory pathway component PulM
MIGNLSSRERTVVLGGAAVAVLVGGWMLVVQPALERAHAAAELVPARLQVLARRQELVARRDAIAASLAATNTRLDEMSERFLTASTPAVAASELQQTVKEIAAQAAMEVRSERILPPVERADLLEIPIEVTVSGDIRQLVDLLARLESTRKVLSVQDLKLRVVNVSQPREILATLTLAGFIMPARAKS